MTKFRPAVGIDAGSAWTRCVICSLDQACQVHLLGYGEVPSKGWTKGRISDQLAMSESIREAVTEAESMARVSVGAAVAGVGGTGVAGFSNRGVYEIGRPRPLTPSDLGYAIERAFRVRLDDDRTMLQILPQDFNVDGHAGHRNPVGIHCSRLEAHVYTMTASKLDHQALVSAFHRAHLELEETIYEPLAGAYASVLPEDRGRGVALLDIGADTSGLVVYDGDTLLLAASIPIGGDHFTRDVAWCLTVTFEDAERLKEEYGCASLGLTADNTLVEVPSGEGRESREVTRRQLNEILEARAEELFMFVRAELSRVGMEQSLMEGVVLSGGGAMLNGMLDVAERVLNCQARNGLCLGIEGWPDALNSPAWTAAAGLSMYSARLKLQKQYKRRVPNLVGMVLK